MTVLVQQILNGISLGATYAAFALGFTLIFGVNRILNLAQGAVFTWGAIGGYFVAQAVDGLIPALLAGALVGGVLSVLLDLVAFRLLRRRRAPEFAALVSSLGALMVLQNVAQRATDAEYLRLPGQVLPTLQITLGGVHLGPAQYVMLLTSATFAAVLYLYIHKTRFGVQIRAVAEDDATAGLLGVNASAIHLQTFFLSGVMAGVAGVLVAVAFNSVHFMMGEPYLLIGLAVIILGGMGSIAGAIVGGLTFGVLHALTVQYVSSSIAEVVPFLMIVAVLLIRPTGLFPATVADMRVGRT